MQDAASPWSSGSHGVTLHVRLTPRSSKDAVDGVRAHLGGSVLQARVRAIPENGAANGAVIELIARWLGLPKTSVNLALGAKSRVKTLTISGDPPVLHKLLECKVAKWRAIEKTNGRI